MGGLQAMEAMLPGFKAEVGAYRTLKLQKLQNLIFLFDVQMAKACQAIWHAHASACVWYKLYLWPTPVRWEPVWLRSPHPAA
jgi:hypothetical protein